MKHVTFSKSAFAVTAILVATACAESADVSEETAPTEPAPATPAFKPVTAPEKVCPKSCTTDADCQNDCPVVAGGVNCCDAVGECFKSQTAVCPVPKEPNPTPTPTY